MCKPKVSEMLRDYLEEHPDDAKTIVQKVILAAQARHAPQKARDGSKIYNEYWRTSWKIIRLLRTRSYKI